MKDRYLALFKTYYSDKFQSNTIKLYLIELDHFLSNVDLASQFTAEVVNQYLEKFRNTRNITVLKHFFSMLKKKKIIDTNPMVSKERGFSRRLKNQHRYLELFVEYMRSERNLSVSSINSYLTDLIDFIKQVNLDEEVKEEQVAIYISDLKHKGIQDTSINRKVSALKQFFQFLATDGLIKNNPMTLIGAPKARRALPKVLNEDLVKTLEQAVLSFPSEEHVRIKLMLCLLYGSGLRVSELIALKQNSFIENKFIRILGKGRKERVVPMAHKVQDLLEQWNYIKPDSEWLFPSVDPSKHITRQRVFQLIKQLARLAGIDPEKVSPHVLRHAFATHILDHGADLLSVKKMLGHESIATTEIYTHVSRSRLRKVADTYHPLGATLNTQDNQD